MFFSIYHMCQIYHLPGSTDEYNQPAGIVEGVALQAFVGELFNLVVDVMIACGNAADTTAAMPQLHLLAGFVLFPANQSVQ